MRTYTFSDFQDFTSLYRALVEDLLHGPEYVISPRGMKVHEVVNATVTVNPADCSIDFTRTKAFERQEAYDRYRKAELEWYLSGNTLASSAPSKFWSQLADQDGNITSNYGHMMTVDRIYPKEQLSISDNDYVTAIERTVGTLLKDNDSRQAIVHYNQPKHCWPANKDFPCTVYSQFFLRDGSLNMTTYQRSCDIIKGFSYDLPWSCHFLEMVVAELKKHGLDVKLGGFTHVFGSLHLYDKDFELAAKITQLRR